MEVNIYEFDVLQKCKNGLSVKMSCAFRRLLGRRGMGCRVPLHLRQRAISRKVAKWG